MGWSGPKGTAEGDSYRRRSRASIGCQEAATLPQPALSRNRTRWVCGFWLLREAQSSGGDEVREVGQTELKGEQNRKNRVFTSTEIIAQRLAIRHCANKMQPQLDRKLLVNRNSVLYLK